MTVTIKRYFSTYFQGANLTGRHLEFDLELLLDSWLEQNGFPLVTVETYRNNDSCVVSNIVTSYVHQFL